MPGKEPGKEPKKRKVYPQAIRKYNEKAYDRFELKTRKDSDLSKEELQKHVAWTGESLNGFICRAILSTLVQDKKLFKKGMTGKDIIKKHIKDCGLIEADI